MYNALLKGKEVQTYALNTLTALSYGPFTINLAAGLEDSIVHDLSPEWNQTGTGKLTTETETIFNSNTVFNSDI